MCLLGLDIPQRDVDGADGQMSDPHASDPLCRRIRRQLLPQMPRLKRIGADDEWAKGVLDAFGDEPIRRQMRVRAGVAVAANSRIGFDDDADHAPMGDRVS